MTPLWGNTLLFHSSQQLPFSGTFWADTAPFKGPGLTRLPELQRTKNTVSCAVLGADIPGHRQEQRMQTLIVHLLKKQHLFWLFQKLRAPLASLTIPPTFKYAQNMRASNVHHRRSYSLIGETDLFQSWHRRHGRLSWLATASTTRGGCHGCCQELVSILELVLACKV